MSDEAFPGPSTPPINGKFTARNEARIMIHNVIECCEQECEKNYLIHPLAQATNRTAAYTGASVSTIRRIRKFCKNNPGRLPGTPGKRRPKSTGKIQWNDFDRNVVRQTIEDFYLVEKTAPSLQRLKPILEKKIGWVWCTTALRYTLVSMGFTWKKRQNKRGLLIERDDIVGWRSRFIAQMRHIREPPKEIFYLGETWVDCNLGIGKCWQKADVAGVKGWYSKRKRLIIGSVGSRNGFVREAQLIFWAKSAEGNYHGPMNSEIFEKWFENVVLPNLPPEAVIVVDNAPYHNRQLDITPTYYDTKTRMLQWLQKRRVSCDESMRKQTLFSLIQEHRPTEKSYVIDKLAGEKGHVVVRLPPYNCDLSALELAWVKVKWLLKEHSIAGNVSENNLLELVNWSLQSVTADDWKAYYRSVQQLEEEYWRRDAVVEHAIDNMIIDTAESDSSDDNKELCTDEEYNDSDSD